MGTIEHCNETNALLPFREGLFVIEKNGIGYLLGNRCRRCGITFFPRRVFCIECSQSDNLEDVKLSTMGTLHTFTTVYRATSDFKTPYIVGYVDLENDGVRVFSPLSDCQAEELKIGMKMQLIFGTRHKIAKDENDKRRLTYKFRPLK